MTEDWIFLQKILNFYIIKAVYLEEPWIFSEVRQIFGREQFLYN